jgi:hypothetical protein
MTISSQHMEQESEEEVHVPFTFVDVNVSQVLLMLFTTLNSLTFFSMVKQVSYPLVTQ